MKKVGKHLIKLRLFCSCPLQEITFFTYCEWSKVQNILFKTYSNYTINHLYTYIIQISSLVFSNFSVSHNRELGRKRCYSPLKFQKGKGFSKFPSERELLPFAHVHSRRWRAKNSSRGKAKQLWVLFFGREKAQMGDPLMDCPRRKGGRVAAAAEAERESSWPPTASLSLLLSRAAPCSSIK